MIKSVQLKTLPFIIFLFGPPAFRKLGDQTNILVAQVDVWIAIQIILYLFSFYLMIKFFDRRIILSRNFFDLIIAINLLSLIISALLSNDIITSLAYTFLYFIGIYYYYYSKNLYQDINDIKLISIYIFVRNIFTSLLIIVLFFYFFDDSYVLKDNKIFGGKIVNIAVVSPIVFFISFYLLHKKENNVFNVICLFISIFFIFNSFSRTTWWTTIFFTFLLFIKFNFYDNKYKKNLKYKFYTFLTIILIFILFFFYYQEIFNFLTRGQSRPFSLSGRDIIATWVFEQMDGRIFGFGLGTGFKRMFPSLIGNFDHLGLAAENIGTAHNAYLEILMAGGWLSFFSYLLFSITIVIYFLFNFKKIITSNIYLVYLLFLYQVIINMVNAQSTIPAYSLFFMFWLLLSLTNINIFHTRKLNENSSNT